MEKNKDLIILIPAFNEEKNLKRVIDKFKLYGDTLIIDDASYDQTPAIAKKNSKYYIRNIRNLGYDYSLRAGISYICKNLKKKKYIITCDGDNQHNPKYIKLFIYNIKNKKISLVIGSRNKFNRFSEKIVSLISKFTIRINDPYSGMKAYKISRINKKIKKLKTLSDTIGLFGILIFKRNEIKDINIKVKAKNKISSYGDNFFIKINLLLNFLKILFYICLKKLS